MTQYTIHSSNLSNSLVFYRSLFNQMPQVITPFALHFQLPQFDLEVVEADESSDEKIYNYSIGDSVNLELINERMKRFRTVAGVKGNCMLLGKAIGLIDPDGTKWLVGDPNADVQFEKCYIVSH